MIKAAQQGQKPIVTLAFQQGELFTLSQNVLFCSVPRHCRIDYTFALPPAHLTAVSRTRPPFTHSVHMLAQGRLGELGRGRQRAPASAYSVGLVAKHLETFRECKCASGQTVIGNIVIQGTGGSGQVVAAWSQGFAFMW